MFPPRPHSGKGRVGKDADCITHSEAREGWSRRLVVGVYVQSAGVDGENRGRCPSFLPFAVIFTCKAVVGVSSEWASGNDSSFSFSCAH